MSVQTDALCELVELFNARKASSTEDVSSEIGAS
jgi:hypothetical protein